MKKPTDAELDILAVLWQNGSSSVREVHAALSEQRDVVYTTTLKTMQVMTEKGFLKRDTSRKTHIYQAVIEAEMIREDMVDKVVNTVFAGSPLKLVLHALGSKSTSAEDLDQIKKMIENLEKEQ
ncbi:BlaI/MecI/CopY family transcriptional regulator [Flavilitoribacter nigricans]|uniref:Transcriptional regulator n=1 Tax=Flavilitoribacter nigricans (strain ATCC 23147 / DSM 23189 / NBRC 102662 / NCIMB 1420 / SS-2) TaxID=1122177 RepID=A0A2D0MZM4_FLAN2|nr:BlaI/MecI/CopY family transcriptional regulator [Flavilitoribacter nigricans]PHN01742.1 transcriptional regulator [Flavilitoribacter nigricans DSM 23189 = NBRC 102662]